MNLGHQDQMATSQKFLKRYHIDLKSFVQQIQTKLLHLKSTCGQSPYFVVLSWQSEQLLRSS